MQTHRLPGLRPWQKSALDVWLESGFKGCVEVATGGGKTTFALAAFVALRQRFSDLRMLVVVPTTALLDQWYIALQEDLGLEESELKILSSADLSPSALVNLSIINTARGFLGQAPNADALLLVVDECHRAGSEKNSLSLVQGTRAALGLSATPYREFDEGFQQYIEPTLGPVIFRYGIEDAITDGVLARLKMVYVRIPLLPNEQTEYNQLTARIARAYSANADPETLQSLLRRRARTYNSAAYRLPVMRAFLRSRRGKRCLVFTEAISAAQEAKALLEEDGHSVAVYHSQMGPHLRRANLKAFRQGVFDVLIACRALDEGFNVPEAELAVVVSGTASKRQRIQRMGRVLRTLAGKSLGEVITLYATDVEEMRLLKEAETFDNLVECQWMNANGT